MLAMARRLPTTHALRLPGAPGMVQHPFIRMMGAEAAGGQGGRATSFSWKKLSPQTKRNVKIWVAVGLAIDTVAYLQRERIFSWFRSKQQEPRQ